MADIFTKSKRSEIMSKIRSKNTAPEKVVCAYLRKAGITYSSHVKTLPGKPDIVVRSHNLVLFVNGCFWHGHARCNSFRYPKSNRLFWKKKIEGNKIRDEKLKRLLRKKGWKIQTIWECQIENESFKKMICRRMSAL